MKNRLYNSFEMKQLRWFIIFLLLTALPATEFPVVNYTIAEDSETVFGSEISTDSQAQKIYAEWIGDSIEGACPLTQPPQEVGYVILVAGHCGESAQEEINLSANRAYRILLKRGFDRDRIFYLNPEIAQDVDGDGNNGNDIDRESSKENLQEAITWAKDKAGSDVPLFICLIDHGGKDTFAVNDGETLRVSELKAWLEELRTDTECTEITVIIDACHSGSFIDELSYSGTVVITSTGIENYGFAVPEIGLIFSEMFWISIGLDMSLADAFETTSSWLSEWNALPDFEPDQTPLLDDNGDGLGHIASLPNGGDGELAELRYIGEKLISDAPPVISDVESQTVEKGEEVALWCRVADDNISQVWVVVIPPQCLVLGSDGNGAGPIIVALEDSDGDNIYEGRFKATELGHYQLVFYATDSATNIAAPVVSSLRVMEMGGTVHGQVLLQGRHDHSGATITVSPQDSQKININVASAEELEILPGIGPLEAQAIIDHRMENGTFHNIEELLYVPGIGSALFEEIKDRITVDYWVTADSEGNFLISDLPPTAYTVTAMMPRYLSAEESDVEVVDGKLRTLPLITLLGGDANGDDNITIDDLKAIRDAFNTTGGNADINNDGIVDIYDIVLAGVNFGKGQEQLDISREVIYL